MANEFMQGLRAHYAQNNDKVVKIYPFTTNYPWLKQITYQPAMQPFATVNTIVT